MLARCIHGALRCHSGVEMAPYVLCGLGVYRAAKLGATRCQLPPQEATYMGTRRILHFAPISIVIQGKHSPERTTVQAFTWTKLWTIPSSARNAPFLTGQHDAAASAGTWLETLGNF